MGTENPNQSNFPLRPASTPFSAPRGATPFQSSPFQPPPMASSQPIPPSYSSGPVVGSEASGFRPMAPGISPPPMSASYGPSATGSFQRFPSPQFSSTAQVPPPHSSFAGPPSFPPSVRPVSAPISSPPVPMVSPPQSMGTLQPSATVPQSPIDPRFAAPITTLQQSSPQTVSSYPLARPALQPGFPGYPSQQPSAITQPPTAQSTVFSSQQGGYISPSPFLSQQGGYVPPSKMPHPGSAPPIPQMHGLAEDFKSLSIGSVPGSYDTGIDSKALPRPLEGNVQQSPLSEMFPMNCVKSPIK